MSDHAHFVVDRFRYAIEKVSLQLKAAATTALFGAGLHPFQHARYADRRCPSPWARKQRSVFLDSAADVLRAIKYVNDNPTRDGLKPQRWKFVTPFVCDVP
jgi:hypothetical protein